MIQKVVIQPFKNFFKMEQASGIILIICTILSLGVANTAFGPDYVAFWETKVGFEFGVVHLKESILHWVNDGLMVVFFFVVGMEIKREFAAGELSTAKKASLPLIAALGGMVVPALFFAFFNFGKETADGWGIPMATDIAFALGILSLAGKRVPISLKIFLTALAVIDDLGAIMVIAIFYTSDLSFLYLSLALGIFVVLHVLNRLKVDLISPYLLLGLFMWYFMLQSGIHATIAGVLLATAIPLKSRYGHSPLQQLEHELHPFTAFLIMPIFALANTAIPLGGLDFFNLLMQPLSLGIIAGLLLGKPVGVALFSYLAIKFGFANMPSKVNFKKLIGVGFLAGIGFTMSIFISVLAYSDPAEVNFQNKAKLAVLTASVLAGLCGYFILTRDKSEVK